MALSKEAPSAGSRETAATVLGAAGRNVTDLPTWARQSTRMFVRSQTQLAPWSEGATGRVLSAFEAFTAFGWPALEQIAENNSAVIVEQGCEAATVLRARRLATGLAEQQVADRAGVSLADLQAAEAGRKRSPIRVLSKLAQVLALDADRIGAAAGGGGDPQLGVRLRDIHQGPGAMGAAVVLGLAEAAWVIASQSKLESWIDPSRTSLPRRLGFAPEPTTPYRPAWRDGMNLAHRARDLLRIGPDAPIRLKTLLEDRLAVPVIQLALPERFAGATIGNGTARGIAVNINGINGNVWVRRMTIAHEIGHLLWDSDEDLNRLRVDDEAMLAADWNSMTDKVEVRANAFAAEFLAPQAAVIKTYEKSGEGAAGVSAVMKHFGIGFTAATWQIHNGRGNKGTKPFMQSLPGTEPMDDWKADEAGTTDFFVIRETPISRRGRFAELCLLAYKANLISDDTAAEYLGTNGLSFQAAKPELESLLAR